MRGKMRREGGVALIELSVILVIIGLLITVAVAVLPVLTERNRLDKTSDVTINIVRKALVSFVANNGRLPCADTSAIPNGLEGSGAGSSCAAAPADSVGRVPFRVLGLPDSSLDEGHLPLRYAVYRNLNTAVAADSSLNADLAALTNRFIPVLPGNPATADFPVVAGSPPTIASEGPPNLISEGLNLTRKMPNNKNDLDFCLALRNAKAATANTDFVHTLDLGGVAPAFNVAFVLASGGVEDADGDASDLAFDGVNEGATGVNFESPARRRNDSAVPTQAYDDLIYAMPFDLLESKLSCAAITIGVNAAANIANAAAHTVVQTEDTLWLAERNTVMDDLSVTLAELSLAVSIFQEVTIIADGIMAGFNTACPPTASDAAAVGPIVAAGVAGLGAVILAGVALDAANNTLTLNDDVLLLALNAALISNAIAARICIDAENADQRGGQANSPATPASPPDRP